jgi:putative flippase GtrA
MTMRNILKRQFVRFVMVGVVNTGFSYAVYAVLLYLGLPYALANLGATLLGILFSFGTHGRLVFGNHDLRLFVRFAACWLVIYAFNVGLIAGFIRLGLDAYVAGALALVPVVIASFLVQKFLVFGGTAAATVSNS